MQRTTESTVITYAKVTINNGNVEAITASEKIAEKDPDKATKIFRKNNQTDSIIKTEAVAETGYITDYVWYLFERSTKEEAKRLERAVKECKNDVFAIIDAKIAQLEAQDEAGE